MTSRSSTGKATAAGCASTRRLNDWRAASQSASPGRTTRPVMNSESSEGELVINGGPLGGEDVRRDGEEWRASPRQAIGRIGRDPRPAPRTSPDRTPLGVENPPQVPPRPDAELAVRVREVELDRLGR